MYFISSACAYISQTLWPLSDSNRPRLLTLYGQNTYAIDHISELSQQHRQFLVTQGVLTRFDTRGLDPQGQPLICNRSLNIQEGPEQQHEKLAALLLKLEKRENSLAYWPIYLALIGAGAVFASCFVTFPYLALHIACIGVSVIAIVTALGLAMHCRHIKTRLLTVKKEREAEIKIGASIAERYIESIEEEIEKNISLERQLLKKEEAYLKMQKNIESEKQLRAIKKDQQEKVFYNSQEWLQKTIPLIKKEIAYIQKCLQKDQACKNILQSFITLRG